MFSFFVAFIHPGLGTSTSQEAKEYFSDMQRHRIPFKYSGPEDDEAITLVSCLHIHYGYSQKSECKCLIYLIFCFVFWTGL